MSRIYQLDAIRGLLAIGVMLYHVIPAAPGALGTYGVYLFFTLSGWALEHVYGGQLNVGRFALARVARLAPLWLVVIAVSVVLFNRTNPVDILLNLTGLFGFMSPGATSIATGGWSIGIEVVCYVLFPLLTRLSVRGLAVLTIAALALRFSWIALVWPPGATLAEVWVPYHQVPSFFVFFVAGMLLARRVHFSEWCGAKARYATILGDMSYGVYLLHPIVHMLTDSPITTLVLTPTLALLVRAVLELPAQRWIRSLGRDLGRRPASDALAGSQRPSRTTRRRVGAAVRVVATRRAARRARRGDVGQPAGHRPEGSSVNLP